MPESLTVPFAMVVPPPEPLRIEMGDRAMDELVESIRELGFIHPIAVVPLYQNAVGELQDTPDPEMGEVGKPFMRYEIVDGHRRYTAAGILELQELPVRVFPDQAAAKFAIMLDANIVREDVTPFEEGVQFIELATKYQWSMDQLMQKFHKSENYINDRVILVQKDAGVAAAAQRREINLGQAKEILKASTPEHRAALLEQAAVHGATIDSLRVMRRHYDDEIRMMQGMLPADMSPQFAPGVVIPPDECIWCGRADDAPNMVKVSVHQYHQSDLKAALEQFGLRAILGKGSS